LVLTVFPGAPTPFEDEFSHDVAFCRRTLLIQALATQTIPEHEGGTMKKRTGPALLAAALALAGFGAAHAQD
jgi:hypothetical protein